jgi:hypothetical protein
LAGFTPGFAQKRIGGDRPKGRDRARGDRGIGRVRLDQDLRMVAAQNPAGEVGRHGDDKADIPARNQEFGFGRGHADMGEAVIAGGFKRTDHGAGKAVLRGGDQGGGQALRIAVDREAEQHQLHQRHADHHCEGDRSRRIWISSLVISARRRRSEKRLARVMLHCPVFRPSVG